MNNALILLSGGLDSFVALDIAKKDNNMVLALNFNYGQKAFKEENDASKEISKLYNIELKTIELNFLKELCDNALTNSDNDNFDKFEDVWIPNRNGLFLNIAGSYCDKYNIQNIIMGLNKEEAEQFSDNSLEFIEASNNFLLYSTQVHAKIIAPCKNMNKVDIVNYAIDNNLSFDLIKSCYNSMQNNKKHCLECMSCKLLYNAVIKSKKPELIKEIF